MAFDTKTNYTPFQGIGCVTRRDCLLKDALEGMVNGRRVRGKRRYQMIDDLRYMDHIQRRRPGWRVGIVLAFYAEGCRFDPGPGRQAHNDDEYLQYRYKLYSIGAVTDPCGTLADMFIPDEKDVRTLTLNVRFVRNEHIMEIESAEGQHALALNIEKVQAGILVNRLKRMAGEHPEITLPQLLRNELHVKFVWDIEPYPRERELKNYDQREEEEEQSDREKLQLERDPLGAVSLGKSVLGKIALGNISLDKTNWENYPGITNGL
ncbi:hypothetical protein ANN_26305 [Periplaneta americana]|uniref:Uncharacterized protein n=1 Tax=Periplaneta americana TaxID=6978 RepID=A0ABQ8S606_PERAM|nr:hypothetical protein ANN_26305 [Periplaneta americana]